MEHGSRSNLEQNVTSLASAVRNARTEGVERSQVVAELRGAEIARLEMLKDAISPVLAQVPTGVDMFDAGIVPGEHPRLFIDMIGFVEMARDRRTYRLVQDTRHGRIIMAESDKIDVMEQAATNYIARRLVERERALASDTTRLPDMPETPAPAPVQKPRLANGKTVVRHRRRRWLYPAMRFLIEFLGVFTLALALMALCWFAWQYGYPGARAWLAAHTAWNLPG